MNVNITIKSAALAAALLGLVLGASSCNTSTAGLASSVLGQLNKPAGSTGAALQSPAEGHVTGRVVGPDGKITGKQMQVHTCLNGLDVMRHPGMKTTMLFKCREGLGGMGYVTSEGALNFQGPVGRSYDIIVWMSGYEPLIVRGITVPGDLGTIKIKGYNKTLQQVNHTTRDDLSPL